MDTDEHRAVRELIGSYVLGQLDGADHAAVRTHVDSCASCRAEARALSPLASSLRTLDPAHLTSTPELPPDLGERVVERIRQDRRAQNRSRLLRRGGAALLVAASLVVAFTVGRVTVPATPPGPPVQPVTLTVVSGVRATAGLVRHTWGTELQLQASGLEQGAPYAVRFETDSGTQVSAGSFIGTGDNTIRCSVNAAVPLEDAARVSVTDRAGVLIMNGEIA